MHLVHKIYKHEVTHSESVTERTPIVQRSYELIHQIEKKIIVGDVNTNTGQDSAKYWNMEFTLGIQY